MPPESIVMEPRRTSHLDGGNMLVNKEVKHDEELTKPLSYAPAERICTNCGKRVTSNLRYHITDKTHCIVFVLSIVTWPIGSCFISGLPYCMKWCQVVEHLCPNCNHSLGKYSKI